MKILTELIICFFLLSLNQYRCRMARCPTILYTQRSYKIKSIENFKKFADAKIVIYQPAFRYILRLFFFFFDDDDYKTLKKHKNLQSLPKQTETLTEKKRGLQFK